MCRILLILFAFLPIQTWAIDNLWVIDATGGGAGTTDGTSKDIYEGAVNFYQAAKTLGLPKSNIRMLMGGAGFFCYASSKEDYAAMNQKNLEAFRNNPKNCKLADPIIRAEFGDYGQSVVEQGLSYGFNYSAAELEFARRNIHTICNDENSKAPANDSSPQAKQNDSLSPAVPSLRKEQKEFKNIFDLDNDGESDVSGDANLATINRHVDLIISEIEDRKKWSKNKSKPHVFLDLNDHGWRSEDDWTIGMGGNDITTAQVQTVVDKLNQAGVVVHLNAEACYSGGFKNVRSYQPESAETCVTTDTDERTAASGSDDPIHNVFSFSFHKNLGKFGSQLSAYACSLGQDSWNRPQTSLDRVVQEWQSKSKKKTMSSCPSPHGIYDLSNYVLTALARSSATDSIRKRLLRDYEEYFTKIAQSCAVNRQRDVDLTTQLEQCLPEVTVSMNEREAAKKFWDAEKSERYDLDLVRSHVEFLLEAPPEDLVKFRSAFCCLAYNFRTGKSPSVCD